MIYSKETRIGMLQYRISLLMRDEVKNFNLLRKVRRELRKLQES
jgi:hypothetical protein